MKSAKFTGRVTFRNILEQFTWAQKYFTQVPHCDKFHVCIFFLFFVLVLFSFLEGKGALVLMFSQFCMSANTSGNCLKYFPYFFYSFPKAFKTFVLFLLFVIVYLVWKIITWDQLSTTSHQLNTSRPRRAGYLLASGLHKWRVASAWASPPPHSHPLWLFD